MQEIIVGYSLMVVLIGFESLLISKFNVMIRLRALLAIITYHHALSNGFEIIYLDDIRIGCHANIIIRLNVKMIFVLGFMLTLLLDLMSHRHYY